jgi:gamma-glutamyl:cysteine ligase YbdK (ATP-grasp superfamily)
VTRFADSFPMLLGLAAGSVFGQGAATGTISGRVTDPSDAPVAEAATTVTNTNTGVNRR